MESQGKLSHGGRGTPLVVASLDEKRGVYVVVGTGGGGGGPDSTLVDREAAKARQAGKQAKAKKKEESRQAKEKIREQKRAARQAAGTDDEDALDTESEGSDDSDSSDSGSDGEEEKEKGYGLNRFGSAFQEVVTETSARVRIDSFEHSVVEVKKEDLGGFLESLSMKAVVG
jgi:cell division control protein 45